MQLISILGTLFMGPDNAACHAFSSLLIQEIDRRIENAAGDFLPVRARQK